MQQLIFCKNFQNNFLSCGYIDDTTSWVKYAMIVICAPIMTYCNDFCSLQNYLCLFSTNVVSSAFLHKTFINFLWKNNFFLLKRTNNKELNINTISTINGFYASSTTGSWLQIQMYSRQCPSRCILIPFKQFGHTKMNPNKFL